MKRKTLFALFCVLVLIVGISAQDEVKGIKESVILLNPHFDNQLKIGEYAWFTQEENAGSTGYHWEVIPDNSGVYELVKIVSAYPHVEAAGAPGRIAWKFKMIKKGEGAIKFELIPPGKKHEKKDITVKLKVEE